MFGEKIGRFIFYRIRLPLFLVVLTLCPIGVGVFLFIEKQSVDLLWEQLQASHLKSKTAIARKDRKEKFLQRHSHADPYFISKELESLSFLEEEKGSLKTWMAHPAISHKEIIRQRVRFLESRENRLAFEEEDIRLSKAYKETVEKQKHSVEIDGDDLKKILSLVEDSSLLNMPQLIISEFSLHKKSSPFEREVLEVKLDLFKREFLSP